MSAQPGRFVPLFPSETLLRGFDGQPPFLGCGISTDIIVTAWATLGESQIKPNGRPFDAGDFENQLKVGWRAFEKVRDSNGMPDRDDAQRIHRAMFRGLPDLIPLVSRDFDEVEEALKADFAISIALHLSVLPAGSPLRKYTSADHQVPLVGIERGKSTRQDPMHGPSLRYAGEKVPLGDVAKAAKAFPDAPGLVMAWKVPIGGWTAAALQTEGLRDRLRDVRDMNVTLTDRVEEKIATIAEQKRRITALEAGGVDCSGPVAAEHERTLVKVRDAVDAMRGE